MKLDEGFDIKLENVDSTGLPANRAMWCLTVSLPNARTKKICVRIPGLVPVSNPGNFDGKTATNNDKWEWKSSTPKGTANPTVTEICWEAKSEKDSVKGTAAIQLYFIGPGNGGVGRLCLTTETRIKLTDTNKTAWQDKMRGYKDKMEVPLALAVDEVSEEETQAGAVVLSDVVDLDALLTAEVANLPLLEINEAPLKGISAIDVQRIEIIAETFSASTIGDLLNNKEILTIHSLAKGLGMRDLNHLS